MSAHRFGRRTLKTIVLLVPLALLIGLGILMVRRYYRGAERDLAPILAAEATRALGHEVQVGSVTLKGGFAYVDDVRVAEGKTMAERGPLATARQVIVDFDLRTILLTRRLPVPLFGNIRVIDPAGRAVRDARGIWNFEDFIKERPGPKKRSPVGHVVIENGVLDYSDAALPRNPRRPAVPVTARFNQVNGDITFFADRTVTWDARGAGSDATLQSGHVTGSYDPVATRLLLRVQATGFSLPLLARLLPPDVNVTTGLASGRLTLVRSPETVARRTGWPVDIQANVNIADATVISSRFREPASNVDGSATVANEVFTVRLNSGFAGSKLHAEGTILGASDPALNGWATGSGVELQRIVTALNLDQRYPALKPLREIKARADVRADVRGRVSSLDVRASGPATLSGTLPGGAALTQTGSVQVAFSGPFSAPRVVASGLLPRVTFREYAATDVAISGAFTPERAAVSFQGGFAGGSVAGRAEFQPAGGRTRYTLSARARRVNLARIPLNLPRAGSSLAGRSPERLSGIASLDVTASGRFDQGLPQAAAEIQAQSIRYAGWDADRARAHLRIAGDLVVVEPLVIKDDKGEAVVRGTIDTRTNQLDLRAEAERLDVARFAGQLAPEAPPGKAKNQSQIEGLVYLRDGRVTGTLGDPRFSGRLYAYDVQTGRYGIDYAVARVEGTRDSVTIIDGDVYRFPSAASVRGIVSRPFGRRPLLSLTGDFRDLEALDLVQLAGSDIDVSGIASGSFQVVGPASQPQVSAPRITIADARIGEYDFRSVSGGLHYDPSEAGGTWRLQDFVATRSRTNPKLAELTTVRGSASLDGRRRFRVDAAAANVDLDLLAPYVSDYVTLAGVGEVTTEAVTGSLVDGKAADLKGRILATTQGLMVNGQSLGELHGSQVTEPASVTLSGETVTSDDIAVGGPNTGITLVRRDAERPALVYNRTDSSLRVDGEIRSLEFEKIRQALAKSPYLAAHPENPAAKYLGPTIAPLEGSLAGSFAVTGTTKNPVTDVSWFSNRARIEGQDIQVLEGRVIYDRNRLTLSGRNGRADAMLQADETVVNAHGTMTFEENNNRISADADLNNLPLSLLGRWFPGQNVVRDLSGTADTIILQARGLASAPSITASALLTNILWVETIPPPDSKAATARAATAPPPPVAASQRGTVTRHDAFGRPVQAVATGREFRVRRVEVSTVRINTPDHPNRLEADDIHVTLEEQPSRQPVAAAPAKGRPAPRPAQIGPQPPRTPATYVVYGSGGMDFDWSRLEELAQPNLDFRVRVPKQSLGLLAALTPTSPPVATDDVTAAPDLEGTVEANFRWNGTLKSPTIRGNILIDADHVRLAQMTTQFKNLHADLVFTGDTLSVRDFTTQTQVINPQTGAAVRTSNPQTPLQINGAIPLNDQVVIQPRFRMWPPRIIGSRLHVSGDNLIVAEAPLPIVRSGRLVAEDISVNLDIAGTLFRPLIEGTLSLSQGDFRAPEITNVPPTSGLAFAAPIFNLAIVVGSNVRISSAQLSATVHTEPGSPILVKGDVLARNKSEVTDPNQLQVAGNLLIDRGTLNLPTARFTVQRGGIVSLRYPSYDYSGPRSDKEPEPILATNVNLTAITRLNATSVSGARKRYTITVEARGPINTSAPLAVGDEAATGVGLLGERGLRLTFKSDPSDLALTSQGLQQRIVGLLGGQAAIESLFSRSPDVARLLRTQLTEALSNAFLPELFERLGIGQALGLEEFSIDINQLNAFTLRVTRQLIGPFYATYLRRLSGTGGIGSATTLDNVGWEFRLSYRLPVNLLRANLQFSYTIDDQRTNAYLLEGVFKF